jgi:hypothetical protein
VTTYRFRRRVHRVADAVISVALGTAAALVSAVLTLWLLLR